MSAAHSDTGCSGGRRCATPCLQPVGRSGRTPAPHTQHTLWAQGWKQLLEAGIKTDLSELIDYNEAEIQAFLPKLN